MAIPEIEVAKQGSKARQALLKRLIDTVALPASRISQQDRNLAGDILLEMLFQLSDKERQVCAKRLQDTLEAPRRLMSYLAQCRIEIAGQLLEENKSYDASDLVQLIGVTSVEHHILIAGRKSVPVSVSDALIATREPAPIRILLGNTFASLSEHGLDQLIQLSQQNDDLCELIAKRPELKPNQAMAMFWWADGPTRKLILTKHAADRMILIDLCSDIFTEFSKEDWNDPVARTTFQMIERRQRNRAALKRSEFDSLEDAVSHAATRGMTPETLQEIGYLAGLKPVSIAKIVSDIGGEGLAVLCKGTGLKRDYLARFWRAMRRPLKTEDGQLHAQFAYVLEIYDIMSVVKAQTVLRYWNWSLTSHQAYQARQMEAGDELNDDVYSSARRTAKLVFGD